MHRFNVAVVCHSYMFRSLKVTVTRLCNINIKRKLYYIYLVYLYVR